MNLTSQDIYDIPEIKGIIQEYIEPDYWYNFCKKCRHFYHIAEQNSNLWEESFIENYECFNCNKCKTCKQHLWETYYNEECKKCRFKKCQKCKCPLPENREYWKLYCWHCWFNVYESTPKQECSIIVSSDED